LLGPRSERHPEPSDLASINVEVEHAVDDVQQILPGLDVGQEAAR